MTTQTTELTRTLHVPILRFGRVYESLDQLEVTGYAGGPALARLSVANAGLIRKDLKKIDEIFGRLRSLSCARVLQIMARAADLFMNATLPMGSGGATQSPTEYVETLSKTSGLPHVMCQRNMEKVRHGLADMDQILRGLTRGMDLSIIDRGTGEQAGVPVSYFPAGKSMGVVLPSNSPGVNTLWLPAVALKIPVVIKPGREEPWTPYRIIQALIAAGYPEDGIGFYPTTHEGAETILSCCDRALLFGDADTAERYRNISSIEIHGPGRSKVIVGEDEIENWPEFLNVMADSILANGGRSCINASVVIVPRHGKAIAEALARRLGPVGPKSAADASAEISAFAQSRMAEWIDGVIEDGLKMGGAADVTATHRGGPRHVEFEGGHYLRPTVIYCDSFDHPLVNREFLFPFVTVVEVPQAELLRKIGPTLVVAAITSDEAFIASLLASEEIGRLNLGRMPTTHVRWDQPHEGNLFEFLYKRRAIQHL